MSFADKYCKVSDDPKDKVGKVEISNESYALTETIEEKLERIRLSLLSMVS